MQWAAMVIYRSHLTLLNLFLFAMCHGDNPALRIMRIRFDAKGKATGKPVFADGWLQGQRLGPAGGYQDDQRRLDPGQR